MQLASLAALIWTLALAWKIARVAGGGLWGAMASVWLLAGCFAVWLYGMYPDTYTLPLPFVLASFLALWQVGWERRRGAGGGAGGFPCGDCHAAASKPCVHGRSGADRAAGGPQWRLDGDLWLAVFGLVVGAVYLWAGWGLLGHRSCRRCFDWARGLCRRWAVDAAVVAGAVQGADRAWHGDLVGPVPVRHSRLSEPSRRCLAGRLLVEEMHFAATGLRLPPRFWRR